MPFKHFHLLVGICTASTNEHTANVAERGGHCFRAVLAGKIIAHSLFHYMVYFNQSIDEKHSWEGAGVIACHSNNTAALGTLQLLVPLLLP